MSLLARLQCQTATRAHLLEERSRLCLHGSCWVGVFCIAPLAPPCDVCFPAWSTNSYRRRDQDRLPSALKGPMVTRAATCVLHVGEEAARSRQSATPPFLRPLSGRELARDMVVVAPATLCLGLPHARSSVPHRDSITYEQR